MSYELYQQCDNIVTISGYCRKNKNELPLEEVSARTLVITMSGPEILEYESALESTKIYYIQKYNILLKHDQAVEFLNKHKEEKFLLIYNYYASIRDVWFYITSLPDNLTIHCFHAVGGGHMSLFAILRNVPGNSQWAEPEILSDDCQEICEEKTSYSWSYVEKNKLFFYFKGSRETSDGRIINATDHDSTNTREILRTQLRISGITRCALDFNHYRGTYHYDVGRKPEIERASLVERYGIPMPEGEYNYSYKYGEKWMFDSSDTFDSQIPTEEWVRIKSRLETKLLAQEKGVTDRYTTLLTTSILFITEPIKGHRRPSFHYIKGFRCNGVTEIIELSRGELLMKDMIPEEIYCLFNNGQYYHVSYNFKGEMREMISNVKETEVDPDSYNKWAEQRSLHPELLKLLGESYFDTINLQMIKLFNRLPFGALLVDQLITSDHVQLAISLAEYITERAYDTQYFCSQLSDLFPECNGEETSLYKILNISRNTAKYLFNNEDGINIDRFVAKYKAIHYYGGNEILTDEIMSKVETYLTLFDANMHIMHLGFGDREFNFLEYPKLAKQVVRMRRKIDNLENITNQERYTISTQYEEIVRAYVSFTDYQKIAPENEKSLYDPATQRIFVEFSLTGTSERPLNPIEELALRERHANEALAIYKGKADAETVRLNELKYSYRKRHAINKLRSLASLAKDNPDFRGYVVMVPTQVYGLNVEGSIEKEGHDQAHCLFRQYANKVVEGKFTPLWLRLTTEPEKSLVTFSLTENGRIDQTRGYNDRNITVAEAKAIAAWAKSKPGLVTFQSEGKDVAPGGWPSNFNVPSLPKPDKDWLQRLSQVHE